jgi:hypothetical protein
MSVLDRLTKAQASRPQGGTFQKVKGIFHNWKVGVNRIRLVGDYTEVRTHFIAPSQKSQKRKDRGLCMATAFQGNDKIPQVINCPDWDIALERPKKEKSCPICKLNAVAKAVLAEKPSAEEKEFFENLRAASRATNTLKWNIIDRDDPFVEVDNDGKTERVLGFKIASVGAEAFKDITGIYMQLGYDINEPDKGIDIEVTRDDKGARTTYSARPVIEGTSLKVTPLTKEERALALHDLKVRCGRQTEIDKIVNALHDDLRQIISVDVTEEEPDVDAAVEEAVAEVSTPDPAPRPTTQAPKTAAPTARPAAPAAPAAPTARPAAPTASKVPASVLDRLQKKPTVANAVVETPEDEALLEAIEGDGDGLLGGDSIKKN